MFKKSISSILMITLIGACSVSEPTFDSTSQATVEASLQEMFPEFSLDDLDENTTSKDLKDFPPGLDAFYCNSLKMLFSDFDGSEEETYALMVEPFNGMTAADMENYAIENDYVGCVREMHEGVEELGKEMGGF